MAIQFTDPPRPRPRPEPATHQPGDGTTRTVRAGLTCFECYHPTGGIEMDITQNGRLVVTLVGCKVCRTGLATLMPPDPR